MQKLILSDKRAKRNNIVEESEKQRCYTGYGKETTEIFSAGDLKILLIKNILTKEWLGFLVRTSEKEVHFTSRFWGTRQQKSDKIGRERRYPLSYCVKSYMVLNNGEKRKK